MNFDANRNIIASIFSSQLAIEFESAMQYLHQYLLDVAMLRSGASAADLGISERRAEKRTVFYVFDKSENDGSAIETPGFMDGIAVVKIIGYMSTNTVGSNYGAMAIADDIYRAYNDDRINGVLVQVNSGGGEMTAMDILHSAFQDRNKPVVAHVTFAGSAAYGAISNVDEIVSMPNARVGSIGAVISVNKKELEEYSSVWLDLYAEGSKKNEEFRSAVDGDFSKLKKLVEDATKRFQAQVAKDRAFDMQEERFKEALSGAMFFAGQAKYRGLVDSIGTLNYALRRLDVLSSVYN